MFVYISSSCSCRVTTKYFYYSSAVTYASSSIYNNKASNIHEFIDHLKNTLDLQTVDDWNSLTYKQIRSLGGENILKNYSVFEIKCYGCKEGEIVFTKPNKPKGYWENTENIQEFVNHLKETLNLQTVEDWNSISQKKVKELGGGSLLHSHSLYDIKCLGSPMIKTLYKQPKETKAPKFWEDKHNITDFLEKLKEKLNLKTPEDWNLLTYKHIREHGGGNLLSLYSMFEIKCMGCPEGKLKYSNPRISSGFWQKKENVLHFLDKLKQKLYLNTIDDWNLLTEKQIRKYGGRSLLQYYSVYEIKCLGFPDGKLLFSKNNNSIKSPGYWDDINNVYQFLNDLEVKLNLKTSNDWKRLSINQIGEHGGYGLLAKYSKDEIIKHKIEDFKPFHKVNGRSSQRWLFLQIQKLFPHDEIIEDYFHSTISRKTGFNMQFDIFLVNRNIAFEYHGKQHYEEMPAIFAPMELYKSRDKEKEKLCKEFGIQLVVIPYWWDNSLDSLKNTVSSKIKINV